VDIPTIEVGVRLGKPLKKGSKVGNCDGAFDEGLTIGETLKSLIVGSADELGGFVGFPIGYILKSSEDKLGFDEVFELG